MKNAITDAGLLQMRPKLVPTRPKQRRKPTEVVELNLGQQHDKVLHDILESIKRHHEDLLAFLRRISEEFSEFYEGQEDEFMDFEKRHGDLEDLMELGDYERVCKLSASAANFRAVLIDYEREVEYALDPEMELADLRGFFKTESTIGPGCFYFWGGREKAYQRLQELG